VDWSLLETGCIPIPLNPYDPIKLPLFSLAPLFFVALPPLVWNDFILVTESQLFVRGCQLNAQDPRSSKYLVQMTQYVETCSLSIGPCW
jgi:hypothetical protein